MYAATPTAQADAIVIEDVRKHYGPTAALRGISVTKRAERRPLDWSPLRSYSSLLSRLL